MSWCVNRIKITNPLTPARKSIIPSISHHPNNKRLIASGSLYLTYQIIRKVIHLAGRLPSQEVSHAYPRAECIVHTPSAFSLCQIEIEKKINSANIREKYLSQSELTHMAQGLLLVPLFILSFHQQAQGCEGCWHWLSRNNRIATYFRYNNASGTKTNPQKL